MKKVVTVAIGRKSFIIDEDAYKRLSYYLSRFREKVGVGRDTADIMEDLEERIAELLTFELGKQYQVVNLEMVNNVVSQLGMPDGTYIDDYARSDRYYEEYPPKKKFYRDPNNKKIGGVCSGLSHYLNIDVTLIRIVFFIALLAGSTGFWIYLVFWIIAPLAVTPAQKCEMRGIPANAENLSRFSNYR